MFTPSIFDEDEDIIRNRRGLFKSRSLAGDPIERQGFGPTSPDYREPLAPEEEESALSRIGNWSLEKAAYLGSVLDKTFGGRAVRGVLGGKPQEALSIIPLSDTLGITDPEQAVSGAELNKNIGLDKVLGDGLLGTLGGMATEMILDPSTYMTLGAGALTKKGAELAKYGYKVDNVAKAAKGFDSVNELRWADEALFDRLRQSPKYSGAKERIFKTPEEYNALKSAGKIDDGAVYITDMSPSEYATKLGTGEISVDKYEKIKDAFVDQPLAGPVGLKVPFTNTRLALTGDAGAGLANFAGSIPGAITGLGSSIIDKIPVIRDFAEPVSEGASAAKRALARAFNYAYGGAVTKEGQAINSAVDSLELANVARSNRDKNILRDQLGQFVETPEFAMWSAETGPIIRKYLEESSKGVINPGVLGLEKNLLRNMGELRKMYPDIIGPMDDMELLNTALDIHDKARNIISGSVIDKTTGNSIKSTFAKNIQGMVDSGAIAKAPQFSDPFRLGTGELIERTDSSYFPRLINPNSKQDLVNSAYEYAGTPSSIVTKDLDSKRTMYGLFSSLDVENIMKNPLIAGLQKTVAPDQYASALKNSENILATQYKGFTDEAAYAKALNDLRYLSSRYKVDDVMQLPNITSDHYSLIRDINAAKKQLEMKSKRSGLPVGEFRESFMPTKQAILDAVRNPEKYGIDKASFDAERIFKGPITDQILDEAYSARDIFGLTKNRKIVDKAGNLKPGLYFIDDKFKNTIKSAEDVQRLALTAAEQSPYYLPKGATNAAGDMIEEAMGAPYFDHLLNSLERKSSAAGRSVNRATEVSKAYLSNSQIGQGATDGRYDVSLRAALSSSNLNPDTAMNYFADKYRTTDRIADTKTNPLNEAMRSHVENNLESRTADIIKDVTDAGDYISDAEAEAEAFRSLFRDFVSEKSGVAAYVPSKIADNIKEDIVKFSIPKPVGIIGNIIDRATDLMKGGLTFPSPAFGVRNYVSGMLTNTSTGAIGNQLNPFIAFSDSAKANSAAMGETIKGIVDELPMFREANIIREKRGLPLYTDETATKRFNELMHEYGIYSPERSVDNITNVQDMAKKLSREIPGNVPLRSLGDLAAGFWDILKKDDTGKYKFNPGALSPYTKDPVTGKYISTIQGNPLFSSGSVDETTFGPFKFGQDLNLKVENANRGGSAYGYLRQGFSPEVAAQKVAESHVDYSRLTDFEKTYLRRMFPFYTFTRGMVPFVFKNITENPGGTLAQYTKAAGRLRDQDYNNELLPTHLGGSMVYDVTDLPLISNPNRSPSVRTFFTGLELPVDVVANYISNPFGEAPLRGFESLLGQLNPYIKMPLELATNRQFFGHRSLDDLYSPTGSRFFDQVIGNSPLSRVASMGRTLIDDRKTIPTRLSNLILGGRFTDVDMDKWESVRARELVKDALAGSPGISQFEKVYVQPGQEANLSPKQVELLRLQRTLEDQARRAKKGREVQQGNVYIEN